MGTAAGSSRAEKKDNKIIHSLDKGLIVLEALEQADHPLSLNELYRQLGWERATIHRLLETLGRRGYVLRHANTKQYSLGLRILSLYTSLRMEFDVQEAARPILQSLTDRFGEPSHVAIPVGNTMVFIDWVPGSEPVTVSNRVGEHVPMHCTAIGKCFLAFDGQVDLAARYPTGLEPQTRRSIETIGELEADLVKARRRGFAVDNEEFTLDVRCVASPVMSDAGMVVAAIGVSAPKFRMPIARLNEIGAELVRHATSISSKYGLESYPMEP